MGPCQIIQGQIWPCMGETDTCEPVLNWFWGAVGFPLCAVVMILISARTSDPNLQKLLAAEFSPDRSTIARVRSTAAIIGAALFGVLQILMTLTGMPERLASPAAPQKHFSILVVCSIIASLGWNVMVLAMFDSLFKAGQWLRASRLALKRFKADVRGVANGALDRDTRRAASTDVAAAAAIEWDAAEEFARRVAARGTINGAFEAAQRIIHATNGIFAVPLSIMFIMSLCGGGMPVKLS